MQASGEESPLSPFFLTCRKGEGSDGTDSEGGLNFLSVHAFLAVKVTHLGFLDTHR